MMTLIINKSNAKNIAKLLNEKLKRKSQKDNLTKHFGILKRDIDGLAYQKDMREHED